MSDYDDKPKNDDAEDLAEYAAVKQKVAAIKKAKKYFDRDYKRMRENAEFAFGLQSPNQDNIECEDYRANFINREVNQKVATLYSRDPRAVYKRRDRLDFKIWDGDPVKKQGAIAALAQSQMLGQPVNPEAQLLLQDIQQGEQWHMMLDRIGSTLEKLYQYQLDTQSPDFKFQMKQLVRRVVTTGVGYVRLNFCRLGDSVVTSSGTDDSVAMRVKKAKLILEEIDDGKIQKDDPRFYQVEQLMASVASSVEQGDLTNVEERLEFDFPHATSIIIDPRCRSLKGFVGARWIAQQYIVPIDFVRSYFEKPELSADQVQVYKEDGVEKPKEQQQSAESNEPKDDPASKPLCCLWEMFELETKSYCFLVDGYKCYVQDPQPCDPCINRFWPIFALTFNDCEVEPGCKASLYPPSDVDLLKHMQKEWNRSRQALREHRQQSAPMYVTRAGWLTDDGPESDKDKLTNHESGEVVEIAGLPPDGDVNKSLAPWRPAPIDPNVYNTQPYQEDATLVVGSNQPQPPPKAREAATPAVIQEQARISGTNSNVDDLDDLLTELAGASSEIMLREFSPETVERVVGRGAVWPQQNREDFINSIYLQHVAASSGRPNKAVEIANFERIAPLMLQAGANPWGLIREAIHRLDDRLDVNDFAPTSPPSPVPAAKPQGQSPHAPATGGGQGLQPNQANQPVPLPGQ